MPSKRHISHGVYFALFSHQIPIYGLLELVCGGFNINSSSIFPILMLILMLIYINIDEKNT